MFTVPRTLSKHLPDIHFLAFAVRQWEVHPYPAGNFSTQVLNGFRNLSYCWRICGDFWKCVDSHRCCKGRCNFVAESSLGVLTWWPQGTFIDVRWYHHCGGWLSQTCHFTIVTADTKLNIWTRHLCICLSHAVIQSTVQFKFSRPTKSNKVKLSLCLVICAMKTYGELEV